MRKELGCEQSLFSSKVRGEERKTSKRVSVTLERRCREPLVAWALGDERKERLRHWFHTTIWCPALWWRSISIGRSTKLRRSSSDARATSGSAVMVTVTLSRLVCVFPTVFEEKRDCSQSRKEFNSHRIVLRHKHIRRLIGLELQYGGRDVMWKHTVQFDGLLKVWRRTLSSSVMVFWVILAKNKVSFN